MNHFTTATRDKFNALQATLQSLEFEKKDALDGVDTMRRIIASDLNELEYEAMGDFQPYRTLPTYGNSIMVNLGRVHAIYRHVNEVLFASCETSDSPETLVARQKDEYYARMVCGASVACNIDTVWVREDTTDGSEYDQSQFRKLTWDIVSNSFAGSDTYAHKLAELLGSIDVDQAALGAEVRTAPHNPMV
jgi:hypothetical protein